MPPAQRSETAVREYLLFLEDPEHLVDATRIVELKARVTAATDPLDRLKALAQLEIAQRPSEAAYREAFIENAKQWADANDVPGITFLSLGVERSVLERAGLLTTDKRQTRRQSSHGEREGRRRSTSTATIQAAAARTAGDFTLSDLANEVGGSSMTLRKAINLLIDDGKVERLGPIPSWPGPGRAPIAYRYRGTALT